MIRLRHGLAHSDQVFIGSWMGLADPAIAEVLCEAGADWIGVDLEHSTTTLAQAAALIRTIDGAGKVPLVRLSANDPVQIARVMDAGAHGVIVPMVMSAADVDRAYRAMHYPPRGRRGTGLSRAQAWGEGFDAYRAWLSTDAVLVVQLEHRDALPHLDAILGHEGVDAYLVGPYDLSASMGRPGDFEDADFRAALAAIREAAARCGVPAGYHLVEPDPTALRGLVDDGYRLVAYSVDFRMLAVAMRRGREGLG